jgi:multisubunit Na+/H+ antiporter MnhE subunit
MDTKIQKKTKACCFWVILMQQINMNSITLSFIAGLALYVSAVMMLYSDRVKSSAYYFPLGLAIAVAANFLWLYIAKNTADKHDVYIRGLIWDSMIVGCYAVVPVLMYGVAFTGRMAMGVAMIVAGIVLTKI